jgi:hypothetical protein
MTAPDEPTRPPEKPPGEPAPPAYEPPRLTRVGNLRNLLGKTGTNFDAPNPHTKRP